MRSGLWYSFGLVTAATLLALWHTRTCAELIIWAFDGRGTREANRR